MSTPDVPPNGSAEPERPEEPERAAGGDQQNPGAGRPAPRYGQYAPGFDPKAQQPQQPPAYGAPQYGQGQQPPAYGAPQYGQGHYGQSPYQGPYQGPHGGGGFGAPGPEAQRTAVRRASLLMFVTAAAEVVVSFFVIATILNMPTSTLQDLFNQVVGAAGTTTLSFPQFLQAIHTFLYVAGAAVVVNAAVLVLCGIFLPKGKRWARTLGTVFLCLTIGSFFAASIYALLTIALAVASIVLLFRPAVTAFLNAQNQFNNPYTTPKGPTFGNPYGQ